MSIEYVMMLLYCLIIILIILIKAIFDTNLGSYAKGLLIVALIAEGFMLLSESLGTLIGLGKISAPIWVNKLIQFWFFVSQSATTYSTFMLLCVITGYITQKDLAKRYLFMIPGSFTVILAFISIFTGWMFYIDANNVYHQGPINFVQFIVVAFYLTYAGLSALIKLFMKKYYSARGLYVSIILFSLAPLIGAILETAIKNIIDENYPFILSSITISTLIIYLQLLQNQVQIDSLTEIPNRAKFMKYLESKMNHEHDHLYLFVLDINNFKHINDEFGHTEGDRVLKRVSLTLKQFSKDTGYFVARYAGDEFVIVANIKDIDIIEINALLHRYIEMINESLNDDRYEISIAVGYKEFSDDIDSIREFINRADEEMYVDKAKYHSIINN